MQWKEHRALQRVHRKSLLRAQPHLQVEALVAAAAPVAVVPVAVHLEVVQAAVVQATAVPVAEVNLAEAAPVAAVPVAEVNLVEVALVVENLPVVKVQNNVSVYTGVTCEDDVFLGPSCVFTNVTNPRSAVNRKSQYAGTHVGKGATIGANATVVCGHDIGAYAFIGAGAVVTKHVPDYALLVGNPARQLGWMSEYGHRLLIMKGLPNARKATKSTS